MLGLKTLARGHAKHVKGLAREAGVGIDSAKRLYGAVKEPVWHYDDAAALELEDLRDRRDAASRCMYFSFFAALAIMVGFMWLANVTDNNWLNFHAICWGAVLAAYGWRMMVEEGRLSETITERRRAARARKEGM